MNIKVDFDNIVVKEDKNDFNVKVLMLKGEKGDPGDGEANVIEEVQVNGTALTVTNKAVNVPVPVVDSSLSSSSTNPVQNNTIYNALSNKVDNSALENYYQTSEVDNLLSAKQDQIDTINSTLSGKANTSDVADVYETKEAHNTSISTLSSQIQSLASGSPLAVSSTSEMTDTTRVYVLTTDGNWYYYDGEYWQIGGVYQSASLSRNTEGISEIYDEIEADIYSNEYSVSEDATAGSDKYIRIYHSWKKGDIVKFTLISDEVSVSSTKKVVLSNNTDNITQSFPSKTGYFFLKSDADFIRVYIGAGSITANTNITIKLEYIYIDKSLHKDVLSLTDIEFKKFNIYTIPKLEKKTGNLFEDLPFSSGNINNTTPSIWELNPTTSSVAFHSSVLRIRDEEGNLIHDAEFLSFGNNSAGFVTCFDEYGNYNTQYGFNGLPNTKKLSDLPSTIYYIVLTKYSTVGYQRGLYYGLPNTEYHVGSSFSFTNLTSLIKKLYSLNDNSEKTILVHQGTYDLYSEYGGDNYFASVDFSSDSNWRNYCAILPANTYLKGIGKVYLTFNFSNTYKNNSLFSSINALWNCTIENFEITQNGGRYFAHFENAGRTDTNYQTMTLKNLIFNGYSYNYKCIGAGINEGTTFNFENIVDKTTNGSSIYIHTNGHNGSFVNIKNSILKRIELQNWSSSTTVGNLSTKTNIENTKTDYLKLLSNYDSDTISDFDVYSIGTNDYTLEKVRITTDVNKNLVI